MDMPQARARFKIATLHNPRDGEPKVATYSIDQFIKTVERAPVSETTYDAYHFQKSENKRLTVEARAVREAGDIEKAKELKAHAAIYSLAVDRTKLGRAIMPS